MARKRRSKKDPVAQKLDFNEESDEASDSAGLRESSPISESEKGHDLGGVVSPETDALPTAPEQPGDAELIPTDFAHRDRWRFTRPDGLTDGENVDDGSPKRFLITCICLFCLILIVQWIKTEGYGLFLKWYLSLDTEQESSDEQHSTSFIFRLSSFGLLWSLVISLLLGLSCLLFSWTITYHDSLQPGQFPPSPVSPKKFRKQSGHTFHSSYVMALINGVAVFVLSAWWLCT